MRRIYTTPEYKEYVWRRTKKTERAYRKYLLKESRRQKKIRPRSPVVHSGTIAVARKGGRTVITTPTIFSIRGNAEEMLEFFDEVYFNVSRSHRIHFEMAGITTLTADAIVYMLAAFETYKRRFNLVISGNHPKEPTCLKLLLESGFFDQVQSVFQLRSTKSDVLSIKTHRLVQGSIAEDVIGFAAEKLSKARDGVSKSIYATLIEAMANTKQHASGRTRVFPKWWLMAHHDELRNRVSFTFVDNGQGIPNTMKKRLGERIFRNDADLILSALRGEFRTRTELGYRGKGLPKIMSYSKNRNIENLVVVSSRGFVDCQAERPIALKHRFHGTLLSWDFV